MFNIALYQPDIPQNAATIIRLCSCFGATLEIIKPCGFNLNDKRLKRVAMDYLDKKKITIYESYDDFLIKKKNSRIILMTTKTKNSCFNFQFIPKDTLLFGRESAGVPKMVHENSHARLKIPLTKKSRSLNISIAAAIILSEALKQNMFFQND
jgi:tRNA (cytidine/uridine-2'-O-)-methyltransferase|tara:strand:+ start:61 stop:519 length:459 start_codon:yes stop_codon:yes gene_type:complete